MLTRQLVDLATKLPDYKENIQTKLRSIKLPTGGVFTKLSETVEELKKDLPGREAPVQTVVRAAEKPKTEVLPPNDAPAAASGQVLETSKVNPMRLVQYLIAPLLGPLGKAALVLLLVIFMLLRREDLRRRLIRLIGKGRISAATHAMDDAGARVFRYLLMQLLVNVSYGIPVAIGLYFIGVPNAVLWGACATVLRFIPYIGPWIAAAIPVALSLAVSPSWTMPVLTIGLFVALETDEQQYHGTLALWLEHRCYPNRAHRRCSVLDVAMGSCRAHPLDAAHGLPGRHGATRSASFISQRSAK